MNATLYLSPCPSGSFAVSEEMFLPPTMAQAMAGIKADQPIITP